MMPLRFSLLLSCCLASISANAQPVQPVLIRATIRNATTKQPLAYATIYSTQMHTGTYSDENGNVALKLNASDTITVSFLSFESRRIPVSKLVGVGEILLNEAAVTLDTIAVKSTKKGRKTYRIGFYDDPTEFDAWGITIGSIAVNKIINNTQQISRVNTLLVDLSKKYVHPHRALCRVRIFAVDSLKKEPGRDILRENIVVKVPRFSRSMSVDLKPYNVLFPLEGLFIGVEFLEFETKEGPKPNWKLHWGLEFTSTKRDDYKSVGSSWRFPDTNGKLRWIPITDGSKHKAWERTLFKIGAEVEAMD